MPAEHPAAPAPLTPPRKPSWTTNLTALRLEDPPEINYVVDDLLPVGLSLLVAKPKMGKSFLALQLCLAVSSGSPFLGRDTKKGSALYLGLEDPLWRLRLRSDALSDGTVDPDNIDFAINAQKLDDGLLDQLTEWLDYATEPRLIVIDTLGEVMPAAPGRKSDYLHSTDMLRPLQRLAFAKNVNIMAIHHANKNEDTADLFDQVHGSTGITGVADTVLFMSRARPATQARLDITGRDIEDTDIQLERQGVGWQVVGTPLTAALRLSPEKVQVLDAVRAGHHKTNDIAVAVGKSYKTVNKHANELREMGYFESPSTGFYELAKAVEKEIEAASGIGGTSGGHEHTPTAAQSRDDIPQVVATEHAGTSEETAGLPEPALGSAWAPSEPETQVIPPPS